MLVFLHSSLRDGIIFVFHDNPINRGLVVGMVKLHVCLSHAPVRVITVIKLIKAETNYKPLLIIPFIPNQSLVIDKQMPFIFKSK